MMFNRPWGLSVNIVGFISGVFSNDSDWFGLDRGSRSG